MKFQPAQIWKDYARLARICLILGTMLVVIAFLQVIAIRDTYDEVIRSKSWPEVTATVTTLSMTGQGRTTVEHRYEYAGQAYLSRRYSFNRAGGNLWPSGKPLPLPGETLPVYVDANFPLHAVVDRSPPDGFGRALLLTVAAFAAGLALAGCGLAALKRSRQGVAPDSPVAESFTSATRP